jgi:hypothetical protein
MNESQAVPNTVGQAWLEIIKRPSHDEFALAFTREVVLDASVASGPIAGTVAIRAFFIATRGMYDEITFVHETCSNTRTHLEWEGRFEGREIAGMTVLAYDAQGRIESIRLYHRPYEQVVAFAAELARRLSGEVDSRRFPDA